MITLKSIKKPLVAVGSALTLLFGIAFAVNAMDKEEVKQNIGDKASKVFASKWYQYNGSGSITDESNYTLLTSQPANEEEAADLCEGNTKICVINAPEGTGTQPASFTTALENEINNAQSNGTESTNVKLRD